MAYREAVKMSDDSGEDFAREILKNTPFIGDEVNEDFARHILNEAFIKWFSTGRPYDSLSRLAKTENGETIAVYASHSEVEAGAFRLEFVPLYAVKKIVSDCARAFMTSAQRVIGLGFYLTSTGSAGRVMRLFEAWRLLRRAVSLSG
jgi:hypothetical protein